MKLLIKYSITVCILLQVFGANGQTLQKTENTNNSLYNFLSRNIRYPRSLVGQKIMPATFVSVRISDQGKIDAIGFSDVNKDVKTEVTRVLGLSGAEKFYKVENGKTLIFPIMFYNKDERNITAYNYRELMDSMISVFSESKFDDDSRNKYYPPLVVKVFTSGKSTP